MSDGVRCYLITQYGFPAATVWAMDEGDALAKAYDLYGWCTAVVPSCQEPNDWLDAYDREARATHAENEALIHFAANRVVGNTMTALERLFPFLLQDE